MLKRTGEEADYVASFVTKIVFKAKLDSRTGEVISWLFHLTYDR